MPAVKAIRHPPLFPPETISHRESCNLTGHSDWIWSVAFCPNGREIVSGSRDGTVRLWRLPDGPDVNDTAQMVWAAKQGCKVFTVSVSEDGKFVASGGLDGRIVMWCAQTGLKVTELLHSRIGKDSELKSTRSRIWSVVFSPDSKRIASASGDGVVSVWCALTGEQLAGPFFGHIGSIYALAFSPDGRKLVSGGNDGSIRIWDSYSGSLVLPFIQLHTDPVRSLVWAPDGKAIFTASHDSTIRCVEPSTGALLHIYGGNGGPICSLDTSHDGKLLVSASRDNSVRLWSTTNFQQIGAPIQHSDWINTVSLSKDGRYLATAGAGFDVYIWKLRINENLAVGTPDVNDDGSDEGTLVGTTELNPEEFGAQDTPPIYTEKSIGTHGAPEYSRDVSPMVLKVYLSNSVAI
ncbi:WD40-repeat-containing domain protein [Scleroderma yunnanense]